MDSKPESRQPTTVRPGTIYRLRQELQQLPESLKLRNVEWGLLFAISGEHTVAQLGQHFQLSSDVRDAAFTRLLQSELIEEREVSLSQYLRAVATAPDEQPRTLASFLSAGVALEPKVREEAGVPSRPKAEAVSPEEVLAALAAGEPKRSRAQAGASGRREATQQIAPSTRDSSGILEEEPITRAVPTTRSTDISFQPLESPPETAPEGTNSSPAEAASAAAPAAPQPAETVVAPRLSLKALMRFILDRAVDLNAGQLDVYRVFIRVNTRLLKRNGITTLRFKDDHLVSDPELLAALTSSLKKTLGLSCPREVFV